MWMHLLKSFFFTRVWTVEKYDFVPYDETGKCKDVYLNFLFEKKTQIE